MKSGLISYLLIVSFFTLLPAQGADYCVPDHYPTIQDAINGASDGDRIFVRPGTYVENIDISGWNITVQSMAGPEVTIIDGTGNPYMSTVIFYGGMGSATILEGFTITGGKGSWDGSTYKGGGIYCDYSSPTIRGNIIENNSAGTQYDSGFGGGIACSGSSPIITGNIIRNNTVGDHEWGFGGLGGGIYCDDSSSPLIEGNVIEGNKSGDDGGGIALHDSPAQIVNNLIIGNRTCFCGGGLDMQGSNAMLTNNTITGNEAGYHQYGGGGAFRCSWSDAIITNNIIWLNEANYASEIEVWQSNPDVDYNDIRGGWGAGMGNINVDPQWISGPLGDCYLSQDPCQPGVNNLCVDGGDPGSPALVGTTRTDEVQDALDVDMGYHYSFSSPATFLVPDDFTSIQEAIIESTGGDTIVVKPGTYVENIDFFGKAVTVRSEWGPRATVIDGGSPAFPDYGSVVAFLSGEGPDSILEGFTVTNGSGRVRLSNPQGMLHGGGVYCYDSSPTITGNVITGNEADVGAGVSCLHFCNAILLNNVVSQNNATGVGGMDIWDFSQPTVVNTVFHGNTAVNEGGGVRSRYGSSATFTNCTLIGNSAAEGGGFCCAYGGHVTLANSILWNNTAGTGKEVHLSNDRSPSSLTVSYSDVEGGQASIEIDSGCTLSWGDGMITGNPGFAASGDGDFHLTWSSPCKDTGTNSATGLPDEDFEGDPRMADSTTDMGVDEFHPHLYSIGSVVPGSSVDVKVVGAPGAAPVKLAIGSGIQDPPQSTPFGDLWLTLPTMAQFPMPDIGADGLSVLTGTLPGSWSTGSVYPFQALAGGELTNLIVLVVE